MTIVTGLVANSGIDDHSCEIGFGALTKYCGFYGGIFNETLDTGNNCNLHFGANPMMQLSSDTVFTFFLNYLPGVVNQPAHKIGELSSSSLTKSVFVDARECGPLPGTNFLANTCKNLKLSGNFYDQPPSILFVGIYTIRDEISGQTCSYSMNLQRRIAL
jgi:hypothetical protein